MGAFRNQTKKTLFDAHGREIPPGQIIGIEDGASAPDSQRPELESEPPDVTARAKEQPASPPESKGAKASTK